MADEPASLASPPVGASDCELLRDGVLAQPANAWSSGAYLVAAGWVLLRTRRAGAAGAAALALVALGSAAFHGPQPGWAGVAHDASIAALLVAVLVHVAPGVRPVAAAGVLALAAGVVAVAPSTAAATHAALGLTAGSAVLLGRRRRRRTNRTQCADPVAGRPDLRTESTSGTLPRTTSAVRVALVALATGGVLFALGRTGAPACRPASHLQPHAGWHVATAVAAAAVLGEGPRRAPLRSG